jgi:hypothetical protein
MVAVLGMDGWLRSQYSASIISYPYSTGDSSGTTVFTLASKSVTQNM